MDVESVIRKLIEDMVLVIKDYFYKSTHGTDAGHYYHETRLASVMCGDNVDVTSYTGIRRLNIRSSSKYEKKNGSR